MSCYSYLLVSRSLTRTCLRLLTCLVWTQCTVSLKGLSQQNHCKQYSFVRSFACSFCHLCLSVCLPPCLPACRSVSQSVCCFSLSACQSFMSLCIMSLPASRSVGRSVGWSVGRSMFVSVDLSVPRVSLSVRYLCPRV